MSNPPRCFSGNISRTTSRYRLGGPSGNPPGHSSGYPSGFLPGNLSRIASQNPPGTTSQTTQKVPSGSSPGASEGLSGNTSEFTDVHSARVPGARFGNCLIILKKYDSEIFPSFIISSREFYRRFVFSRNSPVVLSENLSDLSSGKYLGLLTGNP